MEITEEFINGLAVNEVKILHLIAEELGIQTRQVSAVVSLIKEGSTIPFIARYRKEQHGSLDEVQVRECSHRFTSYVNLDERRIEISKGIYSQGKLSEALFENIQKAKTLTELDDIYAPYKRKKKTRGMVAQEKGLEPLADFMLKANTKAVAAEAPKYIKADAEKPELSVNNAEEALQGAMDILAERVGQDSDNRALVKGYYLKTGKMVSVGVGDEAKKAASVYQMYWDYSEPLSTLKPHRVLALNRGEREGELEIHVEVEEDGAIEQLKHRTIPQNDYHSQAIDDGLHRLLSPAVLREIRSDASEDADTHGIGVFSSNLQNLLMQPPIKGTRVLGVDPGIRTGTKCAAMDETGKFLGHFVIHQDKVDESKRVILAAIKKWGLKLIAVGNGTGSQEVRTLVAELINESAQDVLYTVVDEDGASVYSASDIAREEFPELDLTIRGAISIGRRLQDPLAELVKIDPKSIGVGLYQHDVNQKALSDTLDEVVSSVVNKVGVNLNTASTALLKYVSGINSLTAKKIVKYRDENGKISSREDLKNVPGMGPKTYEQCAGFLKIPESGNPLDNTWVHPENYNLAQEIFQSVKSGGEIKHDQRAELKTKYSVGDTTLDDIITELKKPNRDPREEYPRPLLQKDVLKFEELREGMIITGKVKNVVDFGAFIDLGIKESALLHISEMSDRFVDDPMDVLKVGDQREFRIISLDETRRRIGVSLKKEGGGNGGGSSASRNDAGQAPRKVVAVRKADGDRPHSNDRPASSDRLARGQGGNRPDSRGKSSFGGDDDGMSYNPFADLLKKKK
jgi:uncharacterized protein